MKELNTVGDYIRALSEFPEDWPVKIDTPAGGGVAIEHREIRGAPVVAVFGSNGGRFGENPLTEQEYQDRAREFMAAWKDRAYAYTTIHGDHRTYRKGGSNDTCYGRSYDRRIVERMVAEGLIPASEVDIERVRYHGHHCRPALLANAVVTGAPRRNTRSAAAVQASG